MEQKTQCSVNFSHGLVELALIYEIMIAHTVKNW